MKALLVGGVVLGAMAVNAATMRASDPVGVYAVVERVVLEPSEKNPERIQIWGAFSLTDGRSGDGYLDPQRGYLYYSCPAGLQDQCRNEWNDIKSVAGTGDGIGFGGRRRPTGRVRKADEKPAAPDAFPSGVGVFRMGQQHDQPNIFTRLRAALRTR